jgi:AraC family transcriptional regulator, transcriptional activator of pobA
MPARLPSALPAYMLYGEPRNAGFADVLHVETIAQRSRGLDWEIRPHRHESLFQILVIAGGALDATLDGRSRSLQGPCAITVPALAAHGFRFAPEIDGRVFTVLEAHIAALAEGQAAWRSAVWQLRVLAPAPPSLLQAAQALAADAAASDAWRALAIDTGLRRLLLELARAAPAAGSDAAGPPARALQHVHHLRRLVDAQYRSQPSLAALAAQIGITPTQLNRVCQRVLGHSALAVLHTRLLLEAQRELAYTTMSIRQVAEGLGFSDAAYFTRFFQRLAGCTPSAWRRPRTG